MRRGDQSIRRFQAASTREALAAVCRACGADAEIIERRLLREDSGRRVVEISARARAGKSASLGAVGVVLSLAAFLFILTQSGDFPFGEPAGIARAGRISALAVLPFQDLSAATQSDHFGEGLAEDLIGALAHLREIRVLSRTSAFAAAASSADGREAGRRLGVPAVIEGSYRREEGRTRIVVSLIDVARGYTLWSATYDRSPEELLSLQREIAAAVADALSLQLATSDLAGLAHSDTANFEARGLYHLARWYMDHRDPASLRTAAQNFERAIAADAGYAQAVAGLAEATYLLGAHGLEKSATTLPRARALAERAIALDPGLGEAYAVRAQVRRDGELDWSGAVADFTRALELTPSSALAHHWYANLLGDLGHADDALAELRTARELEPLSHQIWQDLGSWHLDRDEFAEALGCYRRALELAPEARGTRYLLLLALIRAGKSNEAMSAFVESANSVGDTALARQIQESFDRDGLPAALHRFLERRGGDLVPYDRARLLMLGGDSAPVPALLEEAFLNRSGQIFHLRIEPLFRPLHHDPGFVALLGKLRLPAQ